jgi:hypothetical protein
MFGTKVLRLKESRLEGSNGVDGAPAVVKRKEVRPFETEWLLEINAPGYTLTTAGRGIGFGKCVAFRLVLSLQPLSRSLSRIAGQPT